MLTGYGELLRKYTSVSYFFPTDISLQPPIELVKPCHNCHYQPVTTSPAQPKSNNPTYSNTSSPTAVLTNPISDTSHRSPPLLHLRTALNPSLTFSHPLGHPPHHLLHRHKMSSVLYCIYELIVTLQQATAWHATCRKFQLHSAHFKDSPSWLGDGG